MPQTVSVQQVMAEWRRQGGPARAAPAMARIARRESGLQPRQNGAVNSNGTVDHGLYQINDIWRKDPVIGPLFRSGAIYTLAGNTQAAIHILKVQGPQAWATYNAATDAKYLSGLNFSKKAGSKAAAPAAASPSSTTVKLPDTQQVSGPAVTPGGQTRQDLLQQYLTTRGQPGALLGLGNNLASLKQQTTTVPGATITSPSSSPASTGATAITTGNVTAPKGTVMFEGKRVAAWIAPALKYARARGWKGVVASGFRTFAEQTRIYNSGVRPAARPGFSNHEGSDFPRGAVDVTDAATLSRILQNSPYGSQLKWAGAKDPVHFSHPHNGSY